MSQVRLDPSKTAHGGETESGESRLGKSRLGDGQPNAQQGHEHTVESHQGQSNAQVHKIGAALKPANAANDQDSTATDAGAGADSIAELATRVGQLEKQNRWMRGITMTLLTCGALFLGGWFYSDGVIVNKTIMESQELKLLDSAGNPRLFLRMYSRVPVLQLVDSNGKPRMSLGLRFDDTPFIDLSDKAGRTRATLEMTEEDTPALRLFNENGGTKFQIN